MVKFLSSMNITYLESVVNMLRHIDIINKLSKWDFIDIGIFFFYLLFRGGTMFPLSVYETHQIPVKPTTTPDMKTDI